MAKVTWDELARQNQRDILAYGTQTWGRDALRIAALWDTRREPRAQADNLK